MRKEFKLSSADQRSMLHGVIREPNGGLLYGVVQILHGMAEYIERYDEFAGFLADHGYAVIGHDHLGHGQTAASEDDYGFFCDENGNEVMMHDIRRVQLQAQKRWPGVPYFMLGHSMGSFLLRQYIGRFGDSLDGAVIMGTGYFPGWLLSGGKLLCRMTELAKGSHYRSQLINQLGFGGFNHQFEPVQTPYDWVTSDEDELDLYQHDPRCTFIFTVNGYYNMFDGMLKMSRRRLMEQIPKDLPLLFISGQEDPVGERGRGVIRVADQYQKLGMTDVALSFFEHDRHEVLHDRHKKEASEEILSWLRAKS